MNMTNPITSSKLSGKVERHPSGLIIGEGEAGMQVYDDTMNLSLSKTIKTVYTIRTAIAAAVTGGLAWAAYHFNSLPIAAMSGAIGTIAVQQGLEAVKGFRDYSKKLEEAVSHGWGTREELKRIDLRYL